MGQDMKLAFLGKKIQERLILVGKQLQQNPQHSIWGNYQHVYKEGVGPTVEIYLAYFPIPRTDKDTAKKQLVSDESAKKELI